MARRATKTKAGQIELTIRQGEVLDAIRAFIKINGVSPTRAEIAARVGLKHQSAVDNHLRALERKGWARVMYGIERGIRLLREGVPLYEPDDFRRGSAIWNAGIEPAKEPEWIDDDRVWRIFDRTPDLCLRIRDDAMDKAGLTNGGIVALSRAPHGENIEQAQDGDIVAARVGNDVVLRRYHPVDDARTELRPESTNHRHTAIHINRKEDDVDIIGVVIGRIVAGRG